MPAHDNYYAQELSSLIEKIKKDSTILIKDAELSLRMRFLLKITGFENRPFSLEELTTLNKQFVYYNAFFNRRVS